MRAKKNSGVKRADAGIEVAAVTMLLRYCHTCGFLARFSCVAFNFPAWLKGFFTVVLPSQARPSRVGRIWPGIRAALLARWLLNQFEFREPHQAAGLSTRRCVRKTA